MSIYEFQIASPPFWRYVRRNAPESVIAEMLPGAPECRFADYVRFQYEYLISRRIRDKLGIDARDMKMDAGFYVVWQMLHMFRDPAKTALALDKSDFANGRWRDYALDVSVLKFENLAADLRRALLERGMNPKHIDFIRSGSRKVNAAPRRKPRWREYYDDNLLAYAVERELPIFQMFPEYAPDGGSRQPRRPRARHVEIRNLEGGGRPNGVSNPLDSRFRGNDGVKIGNDGVKKSGMTAQ